MCFLREKLFVLQTVPAIARVKLLVLYLLRTFLFQGLVVGSGIDWASDDEMRSLVLSLGETLEFAA